MGLIVEDGTIVAGAESYATTAQADTYQQNLGNAAWASFSQAQKEQLLRKATNYMQQAYRNRWKGYRTLATQALDWPRQSVLIEDSVLNAWVDYHTIPAEVRNACMDLALTSASGELAPDLERAIESSRVGDISVTYDKTDALYTRYRKVDLWLTPYLRSTASMVRLVRT